VKPNTLQFFVTYLAISLLHFAASGSSGTSGAQSEMGTRVENKDTSPSPLNIQLQVIDSRPFQREGPIPIMIDFANQGDADIFACMDSNEQQPGLLYFEVLDSEKKAVPLLKRFDTQSPVSERNNLIHLRPGEHRARLVDLTYGNAVYDFAEGAYYVVGVYKCPFHGTRTLDGKNVRIADQVVRSNPVRFRVR